MSGLTAANFNSLYNNPTGGSFPTNTSQEIGSNDLRQFAEDIKDSFFNLTDSAFTGAKGINSTPFNLTEFRAIPTIGVSERVIVPWLNLYNDGENLSIYQLRNDTVADDGYNYIRPDDYNAISNAKVWHYVNTISRFSQHGVNSSTQLKALKTNGMLVGKVITYRDTSASNVLRVYELVAGTDAESLPSVVRPTDYATTTNEKVWKLAVITGGVSGLGSTDNAIIRADGTGGSTPQGSTVIVSDTGDITLGTGSSGTTRTVSADGSGSNIDIKISSKGTGKASLIPAGDPALGLEFDGNGSASFFGATQSGSQVINIGLRNTAPGSVTNQIAIYAEDTSDSTTTLAIRTEQAIEAIGTFTPSHKLKIKINGTEYWIQLDLV
jgi:hypothetical protein